MLVSPFVWLEELKSIVIYVMIKRYWFMIWKSWPMLPEMLLKIVNQSIQLTTLLQMQNMIELVFYLICTICRYTSFYCIYVPNTYTNILYITLFYSVVTQIKLLIIHFSCLRIYVLYALGKNSNWGSNEL